MAWSSESQLSGQHPQELESIPGQRCRDTASVARFQSLEDLHARAWLLLAGGSDHLPPTPIPEGELWSWLRNVVTQWAVSVSLCSEVCRVPLSLTLSEGQ